MWKSNIKRPTPSTHNLTHCLTSTKVEKSDAKEYKRDADMHRDFSVNWKATVEVTGMVAQRRARQGIYETQSAEILDKYSSGKARERRGSQDDLRKVRPCVEIKLQPHAIDAITN